LELKSVYLQVNISTSKKKRKKKITTQFYIYLFFLTLKAGINYTTLAQIYSLNESTLTESQSQSADFGPSEISQKIV